MAQQTDIRNITKQKSIDFNREVNKAYKVAMQSNLKAKRSMAIEIALQQPAPRFYVSVTVAMRHVKKIIEGQKLSFKSQVILDMYKEIAKRYIHALENTVWVFKEDVMWKVLQQPAPSYYITRTGAKNILYNKKYW